MKSNGESAHTVDAESLVVLFNSGLARLPKVRDEAFWGDTRVAAEILRLTPQRINQLCAEQGLPKARRDTFYLPDLFNWLKVKFFADLLEENPKELASHGLVDFTLGCEDVPEVTARILSRLRVGRR